MSKINKDLYTKITLKAIKESENLEKELVSKGGAYLFLNTARSENKILLVNILAYLTGKNKIYEEGHFSEDYFKQHLSLTHRTSLQSLHIAIEQCLKQIIKDKMLGEPESSINKLYDKIISKFNNPLLVIELEKLKNNHVYFNDYLETVLTSIKDPELRKSIRVAFQGLNIVRNKLSHSPQGVDGYYQLTKNEVILLKNAKLEKLISSTNELQFNISFYMLFFNKTKEFIDIFYD